MSTRSTRTMHQPARLLVLLMVLVTAMLFASLAGAQEETGGYDTPGAPITEEAAAAFVERYDAIFGEPAMETADEILAEDFVAHLPLAPELDRSGWKSYVDSFRSGSSDLTHHMDAWFVDGDRLIAHATIRGTHDGPLFGVPATGNSIEITGQGVFRFNEEGQVTESWVVLDLAALLAQIGALPAEGSTVQVGTDGLTTPGATISDAAAAAFVERFDALFNEPNIDIADEIFAEDFVGHLPLAPELDRAGWKAYVDMFRAGASDTTQRTNRYFVADDRLILHVTYSGTHDGTLFGVPATGNPIEMNGIGIFRFNDDGLAADNWAVLDLANVFAQIGALPAPAE